MPDLRVVCLGDASSAQVLRGCDGKVLMRFGKPLATLVYLAMAPGRRASRERLTDLLWADLEPSAARHQLRTALSVIRTALGDGVLATSGGSVTLSGDVEVDALEFQEAVARDDLARALQLYAGPFLDRFVSTGSAAFEHWAEAERAHFRSLAIVAAESSCRAAMDQGRFGEAREFAQALRTIHPEAESGWRLTLEALCGAGEARAAAIEAARFGAWLDEHDRVPEPASVAAMRRAQEAPRETGRDQAKISLVADLVARDTELRTICESFEAARRSESRIVLLTGRPGVGKSRLLADVASTFRSRRLRVARVDAYPGDRGVPFAFLASLVGAIGNLPGALGVPETVVPTLLGIDARLASVFNATSVNHALADGLIGRSVAVQELIRAVADERPFALLIDDAHWIDLDSLRVLSYALSHASTSPLLVVIGARTVIPDLSLDARRTTLIDLRPLSGPDVRLLIASLGALPPSPTYFDEVIAAVAKVSGGTPLLVLEALEQLLAEQGLALDDAGWRVIGEQQLRRSVAGLDPIVSRLRTLSPEEFYLLLQCAVAGLPLARGDMNAWESEPRETAVDRLEQLGFLRLVGRDIEVTHDSIADATIELADADLVRRARREVGRMLVAQSDSRRVEAGLQHLAAAGDLEGIAEPLRALASARRLSARREPTAFVARALGVAPTDPLIRSAVPMLPPSIRLYRATRIGLTVVALAAAGLGSFAAIRRLPAHRPDTLLELVSPDGDGGMRATTVSLGHSAWTEASALDGRSGRQRRLVPLPSTSGAIRSSDSKWAVERKSPDSRGNDIYLVARGGVERRLTVTKTDNVPLSWSPDGSRMVIATSAFSELGFKTLGILDVKSGVLVPLTPKDEPTAHAFWSGDGTRIAYGAGPLGKPTDHVCIITVDATRKRCFRLSEPWAQPLGWLSDADVLLEVGSQAGTQLVRLDVVNGTTTRLNTGATTSWQLSTDRLWIASRGIGRDQNTLYVAPAGEPWRVRRIGGSVIAGAVALWSHVGSPMEYLDSIAIGAASDTILLGAPFRLAALGKSNLGQATPVQVQEWRSLSPNVATVDSLGDLRPLNEGAVSIELSAGGWRTARRTFVIVRRAPVPVLDEDWTRGIESTWAAFGRPRPEAVRDSVLGGALLNNGDGDYFSGVYLRRWLDARQGLSVDFTIRGSLTRPVGQLVIVALYGLPGLRSNLATWNHLDGYLPAEDSRVQTCDIRYPAREGQGGELEMAPFQRLSREATERLARVAQGSPLTIRLQILPDGRCGIAIPDERPRIGSARLPALDSLLLVIEGNSVATRMLVGPVSITSGVASAIDWNRARILQ